uniref:T9SS type A sorting domain-containing protein n=1 Tax=candidate division WOR-3 bacterium TaxID=2052148 RepID=A0A7C3J6P2_UNCW3
MKKLLTISLILLTTILVIFSNENVNDNNSYINSLPDGHRNYIIPPQPVLPDNDNATQIYSLPDGHRNYIIPPQPVLPDDDNATQTKSSPDRRRHNIIPPHPVPPQNPVTISKAIDIKNIGKDFEIHIFNVNGVEIKSDINSLPTGKYFLLLKNGNEIYREKIVILK